MVVVMVYNAIFNNISFLLNFSKNFQQYLSYIFALHKRNEDNVNIDSTKGWYSVSRW